MVVYEEAKRKQWKKVYRWNNDCDLEVFEIDWKKEVIYEKRKIIGDIETFKILLNSYEFFKSIRQAVESKNIENKEKSKKRPRIPDFEAISEEVRKKFWSKVNIKRENDCWEWKEALNAPNGYGIFQVNRKMSYAHRWAFVLENNCNIDDGMFICHTCDNKKCVNPKHLWMGTPLDNARDMVNKGRRVIPRGYKVRPEKIVNGSRMGMSKLTEKKVLDIRLRVANGETQRSLAKLHNVTGATISSLILRKTWKHI